jgi:hypothetical protein
MVPNPAELPERPAAKDIVLGVAWATPAGLKGSTPEVVQFRVKNSELADEPIVPAE